MIENLKLKSLTKQSALVIFTAMIMPGLIASSPAQAQTQMQACCQAKAPGTISISATGTVHQAPDQAQVSAGVVTQASTAQEAMRANAALMNSTFEALQRAGIEPRHIQTSQMSLQPRYDRMDRQAPRINGYEARNQVTAKTHNLEQVGAMLDALVSAGVNTINGVEFMVQDPSKARAQARQIAIKAAKAKAEDMARAANVRLGPIISMSENSHNFEPRPMMMSARSMDEAPTPIAAGEQALSVSVNMTFEIIQ